MLRDGMECDELEGISRISFPDELPGGVFCGCGSFPALVGQDVTLTGSLEHRDVS
ncbi:MAG: hypothetical protein RLZZ232_36 [Planctomycetota bacterium]|jgi:hypothetical protein